MTTTRWLGILLAAQLLLALVTWWPTDRAALVARPLLELDADRIEAIEIARQPSEGSDPEWLVVEREGNGWAIASASGYPADPAKVDGFIDLLLALRVRAPMAESPASHDALSVGDAEFGRRIRIRSDGGVRELVVGADRSNSIRVRFADENEVYLARGLSEFAISDSASSYWSGDVLDVPVEEIRSFLVENERGTLRVERTEDGWHVVDAPPDSTADPEKIDAFLAKVTALRLVEPLGREALPEYGIEDGARISWTLEASDQSISGGYGIGRIENDRAIVQPDDDRFVVKVEAANVEPVRSAHAEDFVLHTLDAPVDAAAD